MKKPFENYLAFIEHELGFKLLDWQKTILREIYDGKYPIVHGRLCGKFAIYRAAEMLKEEMARDSGCLPARLYELDGYTIDAMMCDEEWRDDTEWKKEN